jgi:hypothetical protein
VDLSSLLLAGGLLLLRAFDARHVGQASLGTFGFTNVASAILLAVVGARLGSPLLMLELLLLRCYCGMG